MKTILIFLLFFSLLSCNNKDTTLPNKTSSITAKNKNLALVKQYFTYFNKHDWNSMANMYSDSAVFKDPTLGASLVKMSRIDIVKKYTELNSIFSDINDSIIQTYPSGDNHIIVEFVSSGTAPDGSVFELPICVIFTIENGLITKDFSYFDNFEE